MESKRRKVRFTFETKTVIILERDRTIAYLEDSHRCMAEDINFVLLGLTSTALTSFFFFFGFSGDSTTALPFDLIAAGGAADSANLDGSGTESDRAFEDGATFCIGESSTCLLASSTVEP